MKQTRTSMIVLRLTVHNKCQETWHGGLKCSLKAMLILFPAKMRFQVRYFMSSCYIFHEFMGQVFLCSIESFLVSFSTCSRFYVKAVKTKDYHKPHNNTLSDLCFPYKFLIERTTTRRRKPEKLIFSVNILSLLTSISKNIC